MTQTEQPWVASPKIRPSQAHSGAEARFGVVLVACLISSIVTFGLARSQAKPGDLQVTKLEVVDKEGRVRVRMEVLENGTPSVSLCSASGVPRVLLSIQEDQRGLLQVRSENGKDIIRLGQNQELGSRLEMCDERGAVRLVGGASEDLSSLIVLDREQQGAAGLAVTSKGATLNIRDDKKVTRVGVRCENSEDGEAGVYVKDDKETRAVLGVRKSGTPTLVMFGQAGTAGRPSAYVGVSKDDTPSVGLKDASGKTRASMDMPGESPRIRLLDTGGNESWSAK